MVRLLLIVLCLYGAWSYWQGRAIDHPPGVLVATKPVQAELSGKSVPFQKEDYTLTPLARFEIEARVLARENYRFDRGADLSPVDLALGWGPMSDSAVLDTIDISQRGRFYYWSTDRFRIPRRVIETHSANMHLIPADGVIENQLDRVRPGHLVRLQGYLVEARANDGFRWRSSLTRDDTGNGACELIWVEQIEFY